MKRAGGSAVLVAVLCCLLLGGRSTALAGEMPEAQKVLTGNLRVDLFGRDALRDGPLLLTAGEELALPTPHKSAWLAAGLSLLVPGAGEFYAESYWKAALFLAIDVAAITIALSNDKKGNDQTSFYRNYADGHWSVVKYAEYAQTLTKPGTTYAWRVPGTEGMSPWDKPWNQVNWSELNRMERDIAGYYSHTLPLYGEQQYFELIGKYPQFNQGWDDAPAAFTYGDPLTSHFLWYSNERGKANTFYETATRWVTIAAINHILSAVDAAWSASLYNKAQASVSSRIVPTPDGYTMMSSLKVSYSL
jgi:hypothetical protein